MCLAQPISTNMSAHIFVLACLQKCFKNKCFDLFVLALFIVYVLNRTPKQSDL